MAINDYLLSGGFPLSRYIGQPMQWYSGLLRVDKNSFKSNLVSGELTDAYSNSTASRYNTSLYSPLTSKMTASEVEGLDYYQNFRVGISSQDINDENSAFHRWAKDYDANYLGGSRNESSFFDENGRIRDSWKHYNSETGLWDIVTTAKEHYERLSNDGKLGAGHNIYYGKRYYYKDANGQQVWINPTDISLYNLSEAMRSYDNGAVWDDFEITGLKDSSKNNNLFGIPPTETADEISNELPDIIGQTPTDIKEILPLKQNKLNFLPDVIAGSRLWMTLRNNKKVHDIYNKSLHPVLRDTYERYSPVTGDFGMLSLKNLQGADLLSRASRPFTSDASLTAARLLEAQRQANLLQTEGFLADDARIRETSREALLRLEDNAARRSEVANYNRLLIQNVIEKKAENDALTQKANWQSIDLYALGWEKRFRYENEKRQQDLDNWNDIIILLNALKWLEIKSRPLQQRLLQLERENPGVSIASLPEYLNIQQQMILLLSMYTDYLYQLKAKLSNIPYTGTYTKSQRDTFQFKSGGKFTPKLQQGGIASALGVYLDISGSFWDYKLQQLFLGQSSSKSGTSSKKDKSDGDDFGIKDFINILKSAKFLPNDVLGIATKISNIFTMALFMGRDISDLSSEYLKIFPLINDAQRSAEEATKIKEKIINDGRVYDLAYYLGGVFATDAETNKVVHITKLTLNQNPDRYKPMTYGQLLWCTENMPNLTLSHSYLEAINGGISLKDITALLKDNIYKLGTLTSQTDSFGTNTQYALAIKLLLHMANAPDGYYKLTTLLKLPEGQAILNLITHAITMLPREALGRLLFETKNGTGEELFSLVGNMIVGLLDFTTSMSLSPMTSVDENGRIGKSSKASKEEDPIEGFWRQVLSGKGGNDVTFALLKDKGLLSASGKSYGTTPGLEGNMSLLKYIQNSGVGYLIANNKAISFGDIKISPDFLLDIMINGGAGVRVTTLPKLPDGQVNFGVLDTYLAALKKVESMGYTLALPEYNLKLSEILKSEGLGVLIKDGNINPELFGLFLVLEGVATSKALGTDPKTGEKLNLDKILSDYKVRSEDDLLFDKVSRALSNKELGEYKLDNNWFIFNNDELYEGNIFIPLNTNPLNAYNADDVNIKSSVAHEYDYAEQVMKKTNSAQSTSYETE